MMKFNRWLIALLPSLLQIFAAVSESFKEVLSLKDLFFKPDSLAFLNVFAFIFSFSIVSCVSTLQNSNPLIARKPRDWWKKATSLFYEASAQEIQDPKRKRRFYIRTFLFLEFISFMTFLYVTFAAQDSDTSFVIFLQSVSYILTLGFFAGLIYVWTTNQMEHEGQFRPEKFIPNFQNALIKYGIINTQIVIESNVLSTGQNAFMGREVACTINGNPQKFHVSFDGNEIIRVIH